MIKRFLIIILIILVPVMASAQNVIVEAQVDSMMLWIGQQTGLHVSVTCDAGQEVIFPAYQDTIVRGLEIIPPVKTDTQFVNNGHRMTITRNYTVTCFDSALIYIPFIPVQVDGTDYQSNQLALAFLSYDIPEENAKQIFGPKENMKTPLRLYEAKGLIFYWLLAAIAIVAAVYLLLRYRDDKPIIRRIKIEPKIPAHVRAISEIEELRQSGGAHSEDAKAYYTQLTDILREYINDRFGFNATEMTSYEILERLEEARDKESLSELRDLLNTSDMVKFAKFKPMLNENDRNLVSALEFVNDTKVEVTDDELQPKEEETVIEEKRSKGARFALLLTGIVVAIAGAVFFILTVLKLYYLFF
ncbi:MAG: hypothetical protein MJY68_05705 [Bacteroidaceae bacterium]|nr:hypothetical protein [Bacteroidaceae bacterium]